MRSGTLKISHQNGEYTIEFDFADDNNIYDPTRKPNKITGKWTGPVNIVDYTDTSSAMRRGLKLRK